MTSTANQTQLVVIGAGPGGYPAAFRAADLGVDVTLIDPEENPGGVCLYRGCIPSKVLLHVVKIREEMLAARAWGLETSGDNIDHRKLRDWKNEVIGKLTGGLGKTCKERKINYIRGTAAFLGNRRLEISPKDDDPYTISFENAIIASGSVPATIPGMLDSPRVMTSRHALDLDEVPKRMLVIGGGYIGLELGQVYAALGTSITVVEMLPGLLPGADRDLVRPLALKLKNQFSEILLETKVTAMEETKKGVRVTFEGKDAPNEAQVFDKVMVSVGRKPLTDGLGLENTGVTIGSKGFIDVDLQRRTAVPHIFAIGDVAGQPMLAHKATHEGLVAGEAAAGKPTVYEPQAIPFVVFSDPEIAWCGMTEQEAKESGRDFRVAKFPWTASGRAVTFGRTDGVTKLILDPDTERILGVGIAGVNAGELIGQGVLAMEMGAVAADLALTVATHPTLTETIMEAAEQASGQSTHYYHPKSSHRKTK